MKDLLANTNKEIVRIHKLQGEAITKDFQKLKAVEMRNRDKWYKNYKKYYNKKVKKHKQ